MRIRLGGEALQIIEGEVHPQVVPERRQDAISRSNLDHGTVAVPLVPS
jgi:hypothetical protein